MKFVYQSPNGWRIAEQEDLFSSSVGYVIYRLYPKEGWMPYKFMGNSLELCFYWLRACNFISRDEMNYQISLLTNKSD